MWCRSTIIIYQMTSFNAKVQRFILCDFYLALPKTFNFERFLVWKHQHFEHSESKFNLSLMLIPVIHTVLSRFWYKSRQMQPDFQEPSNLGIVKTWLYKSFGQSFSLWFSLLHWILNIVIAVSCLLIKQKHLNPGHTWTCCQMMYIFTLLQVCITK